MLKFTSKTFNFKKVYIITFSFFVIIFLSFNFVETVFAVNAQAYLKPSQTNIETQSEFSVDVSVDSQNSVNAIDLQISYPPDKIEFLKSTQNNSIVSFWQSSSVLLSNGHIRLAGGMIPEFSGQGGKVATLYFKAIHSGEIKISIEQSGLYLADGKGSRIPVGSSPITLSISDNASLSKNLSSLNETITTPVSNDTTPPSLSARLINDPISGNDLVVYRTEDPESGIRDVEMRADNWGVWTPWQEVTNPIVYPKGVLKIELRSINNNNIVTVNTIMTPSELNKIIVIIPIIIVIIVIFLVYNKWRRKLKI